MSDTYQTPMTEEEKDGVKVYTFIGADGKPHYQVGKIISFEELGKQIVHNYVENGELINEFHNFFYNSGTTWAFVHWRSRAMMKSPLDLFIYADLIQHRVLPDLIIETGTADGGSAFWFADLCELEHRGEVITIDIRKCPNDITHPRITQMVGSSTDPKIVEQVKAHIQGLRTRLGREPMILVSLDSDHSQEHVRRELEVYAPLVPVGGFLVVEDTNQKTPFDAIVDYLSGHPDEWLNDMVCHRFYLTMHPNGWLSRYGQYKNDL